MKLKTAAVLIFTVFAAFTPALALLSHTPEGTKTAVLPVTVPDSQEAEQSARAVFSVYDEGTNKLLSLTEREYLIGAVICEMPALYESEALKAQAVAARSYALYVKALREENPLPELKGGHFSVNTKKLSGYITESGAKSLYGSNFSQYYGKICDAVDSVLGLAVLYDGAPICACYHAISTGRTEASENMFASALPYLVPVDCSFDETADGYLSAAVYTPSEFQTLLENGTDDFKLNGEPSDWLGAVRYSASGNVTSIEVGDRVFTGTELRNLLLLRSAAFDLVYTDDHTFRFTVRGYGHGVGMSQNGANELAKKGKNFEEILEYFYVGASVGEY